MVWPPLVRWNGTDMILQRTQPLAHLLPGPISSHCYTTFLFASSSKGSENRDAHLLSMTSHSLTPHAPGCSPVAAAATMKHQPKLCQVSRFCGQSTGLL